jgi:hypothetical protein
LLVGLDRSGICGLHAPQQEQDTRVAAGEDRAKIAPEYAKLQNNEVDKLQKVADRFNVELRAFKAKNTGS